MTKLSIYRPPLWIAAGIAVGISSAFFLPVLFTAALTVLFCIVSLIMFVTGRVKKEFVLFSAGLFLGAMAATLYAALFPSGSYEGEIVGRITDASNCNSYGECTLADGGYLLELDSLTVNGESVRGKASLYLPFYVRGDMDVGEYIHFTGSLTGAEFSAGEYDSLMGAKYGVYYTAAVSDYAFSLTPGKVTAVEQVRFAVRNALLDNCNGVTANFLFAMIFGDTSYLSYSVADSFRNTGTAHLFAVSGLHIGVIYGAITLLLKRVNRFVSVPVSIAFIFFYSAVCSFTPSSVRAAVMCSVSAAMSLFHRRYDSLNAMSLAATVLLLINPMYLLDKGFILSFSAVSGIIFLKYPLQRLLGFLPRRMASSLSVSLSAQVGSFAGLMSGFGYVSAVGILLNVLVLPVLSAFYIVIFAFTAVTLVLPQAGAVLAAVCTPLEAFINAMTALGFESALLKDWNSALTYAASIFLFIGLTDKLNLSSAFRYISAAVAAALAVAAAVAAYVSLGGTRITVATGYSGGIITLSSPEGDAVFLTQSYYGRTDIPSGVSAAVLVGGGGDLSAYFNLGESVPCLYVPEGAPFTGVISGTDIVSSSHFTLCGAEITLTDSSVTISAEGVSVCMTVCEGEYDLTALPGGADIAVFASEEKQAIALTSDGGDYALSYSGALTFALSDGQYSLLSSVPKG